MMQLLQRVWLHCTARDVQRQSVRQYAEGTAACRAPQGSVWGRTLWACCPGRSRHGRFTNSRCTL